MALPSGYFSLHLPPPPKLSSGGKILLGLGLALSTYLLGFALYIVSLPAPFATLPPDIDGLAVFTGGAGRVDAALQALEHGFAHPVLISGRHPQTRLEDIVSSMGSPIHLSRQQQRQITLDNAHTTLENIRSLGVWAAQNNLHHVGIITSTYHTARVRLLGYWHLGSIRVSVLPVQPANAGIRLLWQEYNKLLAVPFLK